MRLLRGAGRRQQAITWWYILHDTGQRRQDKTRIIAPTHIHLARSQKDDDETITDENFPWGKEKLQNLRRIVGTTKVENQPTNEPTHRSKASATEIVRCFKQNVSDYLLIFDESVGIYRRYLVCFQNKCLLYSRTAPEEREVVKDCDDKIFCFSLCFRNGMLRIVSYRIVTCSLCLLG